MVYCHLIPGNSLRSFRKDDGDSNKKVKREIGLLKTTTLHVHHTFLNISLPSMHDNDVKMLNFTFCGGLKRATANFSFPF